MYALGQTRITRVSHRIASHRKREQIHHRIGVEVVRSGVMMRITFNFEGTNHKLWLHFKYKILTRAAISVRSLQPVGNLVFVVSFLHHLASDAHLPCDTPPHLAPVSELLQAARSICCCSNCGYQNYTAPGRDLNSLVRRHSSASLCSFTLPLSLLPPPDPPSFRLFCVRYGKSVASLLTSVLFRYYPWPGSSSSTWSSPWLAGSDSGSGSGSDGTSYDLSWVSSLWYLTVVLAGFGLVSWVSILAIAVGGK